MLNVVLLFSRNISKCYCLLCEKPLWKELVLILLMLAEIGSSLEPKKVDNLRHSLFSCKFSVLKQSLCNLTTYWPFFWQTALLLSDQHSQPHTDTFSKAVCSHQASHIMRTVLKGRTWTDQCSDIPSARWSESVFLEAAGGSCLSTLNRGMLVVWWVVEGRRTECSCLLPVTAAFLLFRWGCQGFSTPSGSAVTEASFLCLWKILYLLWRAAEGKV